MIVTLPARLIRQRCRKPKDLPSALPNLGLANLVPGGLRSPPSRMTHAGAVSGRGAGALRPARAARIVISTRASPFAGSPADCLRVTGAAARFCRRLRKFLDVARAGELGPRSSTLRSRRRTNSAFEPSFAACACLCAARRPAMTTFLPADANSSAMRTPMPLACP